MRHNSIFIKHCVPPTTTEESEQQQPKKASLPNLKKLGDEDCSTLLHACVGLMGLPVDAYALNAILRLLLRLTRTFDYAVIFAQMGGVKMLLDLTQASSFSGFFSLVGFFIIIFFPAHSNSI